MNIVNGVATPEMKDAWRRVFVSPTPAATYPATLAFQWPFHSGVKDALLLHTTCFYLRGAQYRALRAARENADACTCFVSSYEDCEDKVFLDDPLVRGDPRHYKLDVTDNYRAYYGTIPWPLEYGMYSAQGKWGLLVSHEAHAIVGGSPEFMAVFKEHYPDWRTDTAALKYMWMNNKNRGWLDNILSRIPEGHSIPPAAFPDDE